MVEQDGSWVQLVAKHFFRGGFFKRLVESGGDLLLVNTDKSLERFCLFKLNEKENKWVNLTSLGDRILILGHGWLFSASASDLCVAKGNCIIIVNTMKPEPVYVFDLDQRRLSPIVDYPEYSSLFCKPLGGSSKAGFIIDYAILRLILACNLITKTFEYINLQS
ncbi:F-box protein [Trifolium pratense]|uniref:F-box protein n=1 Tax=Trifolium pratense TaxID=57577 RepID=A0A2K3NA84_TRIPR|nr:F-box protein [Trifolium pratense]